MKYEILSIKLCKIDLGYIIFKVKNENNIDSIKLGLIGENYIWKNQLDGKLISLENDLKELLINKYDDIYFKLINKTINWIEYDTYLEIIEKDNLNLDEILDKISKYGGIKILNNNELNFLKNYGNKS